MTGGAVVLVMSDHGNERCGVGSSEPIAAALAAAEVRVVDPAELGVVPFTRAVRAALRGAAGAVVVYPTIRLVERVGLVPRLLVLRALLGRRRWLRVHLHEFDRLRRRHRLAVALLTGLVADRVVVSSQREATALRTRFRGWAGRREVVVVPPSNGSAPTDPPAVHDPAPASRTIGVIGQLRPDKGEPWLLEVLARLDPRYDRIEVAGRDWDLGSWPEALRRRYAVVGHGQVPAARLADVLAGWDLALAPFEEAPHDGRLSLRTPLAHGVPTLTRGPRPDDLQLRARHLLFDDEVDVGCLPDLDAAARAAGAAEVAALEATWRTALARALYEP